jgi:TM2 domain-containing membrane protein YozV
LYNVFIAINLESFGGGGIFFISFAYWAIFTAVATHFWNQPEFQLVGGLLHTVAVCMTPLAVYGLQKV